MTSVQSENIWIRRQQCPCGNWKCYVTCDGDAEDSSLASQLDKNDKDSSSESMVAPYVGMIFKSDDDAFEFNGKFARKNGFSIWKERSRLSHQLGVYKPDFVCYRSGFAPARKRKTDDEVWLLPAYRKIHEADQERVLLISKAGFPIHCIVKVLELEKGIQGGQSPFLERDVRNFVQNWKKVVQENDALLMEKRENDIMELLEACKAMKEADQYFVYDFTVDENDNVEIIAGHIWMIYGVWLGIDNYGRTIFFGCVLLHDEMPRSFTWALQEAIRSELPNTRHVIPIWNILPKVSSWFSILLDPQYIEFRSAFDVLFHLESVDEFELRWNQFGLNSDRNIVLLFSLHASWSVSYKGGYFLANVGIYASYQNQVHEGMQHIPIKACIPIEEHGRSMLTPFAFRAFQQEFCYCSMQYLKWLMVPILCAISKGWMESVLSYGYQQEQIHCSCEEFESSGILCRRALHGTDKWFHEFHSPTETLVAESSITKEHSEFVQTELRKELTRLLNELRIPCGLMDECLLMARNVDENNKIADAKSWNINPLGKLTDCLFLASPTNLT
ncbi:hypothetical protein RJ641_033000 [Dillenia turbinata]|uniref:Protein FAR1-RELATED SEQUENCE n=1 Tax=Dillenia turbinata TaxID=194707 RepID=A0AAN8ZIY8_9MAGN